MVTRVNNGLDFGIPILNMVNCTTTGAKNDPKIPDSGIHPWVKSLQPPFLDKIPDSGKINPKIPNPITPKYRKWEIDYRVKPFSILSKSVMMKQ